MDKLDYERERLLLEEDAVQKRATSTALYEQYLAAANAAEVAESKLQNYTRTYLLFPELWAGPDDRGPEPEAQNPTNDAQNAPEAPAGPKQGDSGPLAANRTTEALATFIRNTGMLAYNGDAPVMAGTIMKWLENNK